MVLMNAGKRAKYTSSITNRNQGGGDKKAGLVPRVGKDYMFAVYAPPTSLKQLSFTMFPNTRSSRPITGVPKNYIGDGGRY